MHVGKRHKVAIWSRECELPQLVHCDFPEGGDDG